MKTAIQNRRRKKVKTSLFVFVCLYKEIKCLERGEDNAVYLDFHDLSYCLIDVNRGSSLG